MADADLLRLEYVPLDKATLWDKNPKAHDIGALVTAIWRYGFQDPPKYDSALGGFVYGNGRTVAVMMGKREGRKPPIGVAVLDGSDEWAIPVVFGNDLPSREVAEAFAIDHNNLTVMGGDGVTPWDLARMWDGEAYRDLLGGLAATDLLPVSVDGDDLDALLNPDIDYDELWQGMPEFEQESIGCLATIRVRFATVEDIKSFAELIGQTVTEKTKAIWYPKREQDQMGTKEGLIYSTEDES